MRWKWLMIVLAGLIAAPFIAAHQQQKVTAAAVAAVVVEKFPEGKVDWTYGYVQAVGEAVYPSGKSRAQARLLARRSAIMDAQRDLLEILAGVRVSAESTMRDFEVASDIVRTRVEGIVKGAQIVEEKDLGDSFQVTIRIPMRGELAGLVNEAMREPKSVDEKLTHEQMERFSPPELPEERRFVPPALPEVTPLPLPKVQEGPFTW